MAKAAQNRVGEHATGKPEEAECATLFRPTAPPSSPAGRALRGDLVDRLDRQGRGIVSLEEIEDVRDLAGRPRSFQRDPTVRQLVDSDRLPAPDAEMLQVVFAQCDPALGADSEDAH